MTTIFCSKTKTEFHISYCANWLSLKQKHFQFVFSLRENEFRIEFGDFRLVSIHPHINASKYDKICYAIQMKSNKQQSAFSI